MIKYQEFGARFDPDFEPFVLLSIEMLYYASIDSKRAKEKQMIKMWVDGLYNSAFPFCLVYDLCEYGLSRFDVSLDENKVKYLILNPKLGIPFFRNLKSMWINDLYEGLSQRQKLKAKQK